MYPFGLNDNIKGFGNISLSDLSTSDINNTPYFTIPQTGEKVVICIATEQKLGT